jgi:hypothetical protein
MSFFVIFGKFGKRLVPTLIFAKKMCIFAKIRVRTSFRESGQVRKKLEKLVPTLIFEKRQFPKLAKQKFWKKTSNAGPYLRVNSL